jgi:hypothetical protein
MLDHRFPPQLSTDDLMGHTLLTSRYISKASGATWCRSISMPRASPTVVRVASAF